MSPKEKAKELLNSFHFRIDDDRYGYTELSIDCAIICLDQIIEETKNQSVDFKDDLRMLYWQQVKTEIQKL